MIYGFDDNKNRVEVPDANFKIVDYNYDLNSNSEDNPLLINVGEAVITEEWVVNDDFRFKTLYVSENKGAGRTYLVIKIVPMEDNIAPVDYVAFTKGEYTRIFSNVYTDSTNSVTSYIDLDRYGFGNYDINTLVVSSYNRLRWFILRIS